MWENKTDKRKFYNVTFSRSYLDEEKRFHDANSFGRDDLPLVAKLADEAHTFIFKRLSSRPLFSSSSALNLPAALTIHELTVAYFADLGWSS